MSTQRKSVLSGRTVERSLAGERAGSRAVTVVITAGRRRVEISKPDKALFPTGETKADLARYYEAVADVMLPHVAGRPLNLQRFPDGIDGHEIFQQRISGHFPSWVGRVDVETQDGRAT
ncbi:MAG TPA: hypothetical protein VGJ70_18965, partial [Solirubrobacteraceae bacterium]